MQISEVYDSTELRKLKIEETTTWSVKTTYIWVARYPRPAYSNDSWYRVVGDTAEKIWRIKKIEENESSWVTETFFPNGDSWFNFAWDDRDDASLSYI